MGDMAQQDEDKRNQARLQEAQKRYSTAARWINEMDKYLHPLAETYRERDTISSIESFNRFKSKCREALNFISINTRGLYGGSLKDGPID